MNAEDLIAHSSRLVEAAADNHRKLLHVTSTHQLIQAWLLENGLTPLSARIRPRASFGFELIYTFDDDALASFAFVERRFWECVRAHIWVSDTINQFLRSECPEPLASVRLRKENWDLVVTPHPDVTMGDCPDLGFWTSASIAEKNARDEREYELRWRAKEAMAAAGAARVF